MDLSSSKKILAVALASSALLAGCHDDDDAPVTTPVATSELSGIAVKGPLQFADVVACEFGSACASAASLSEALNAAGFLGTDETDSTGAYSIDVAVSDDPVLVRMFSKATTVQTCDYDGCDPAVGAGLELSTVVFVEEDTPVTAPVSVLSTIATSALLDTLTDEEEVAFADATPASISENLATASSNALAGLGVTSGANVFTTDIVASTTADLASASDDTVALSVINASIGGISTDGESLADTVSRVSTAVTTFVADAIDDGSADLTAVAVIAASLSSEIATNATDVGEEVDNTLTINDDNVVDQPDVVEDPTGASSGGDSTGA